MSETTIPREPDERIEACVTLLRECWHDWGESAHDDLSRWIDWAEYAHGDLTESDRDAARVAVDQMLTSTGTGAPLDMLHVWAEMLGLVVRDAA